MLLYGIGKGSDTFLDIFGQKKSKGWTFLENGGEIEKPLAHKSSPKMLLYGIGVIGVRYVVWPEMAKIGIFGQKNQRVGLFSKTA